MDPVPMLLQRTLALPDGTRVRLRLARPRDFGALTRLLGAARAGDAADAARLLRFDPRREAVICACALRDGEERLVGVGAIQFSSSAPELVVVEPGSAEDLGELVAQALVRRADAHAANRRV